MKLYEYIEKTNWDDVLDFIETFNINEDISTFYFLLNDLSELTPSESKSELIIIGYFNEDYDLLEVGVSLENILPTSNLEDWLNSEVIVLTTNKKCDTETKILSNILIKIYNTTLLLE